MPRSPRPCFAIIHCALKHSRDAMCTDCIATYASCPFQKDLSSTMWKISQEAPSALSPVRSTHLPDRSLVPIVQSGVGANATGDGTVTDQSHPDQQCKECLTVGTNTTGFGTVTIQSKSKKDCTSLMLLNMRKSGQSAQTPNLPSITHCQCSVSREQRPLWCPVCQDPSVIATSCH